MASQIDEAERRVRDQRTLIERKLATLEGRVGDDLSHVRARLEHHITHAADTLPGGPQMIQQAEQHPAAALAGGLGLGVAVGMLGGGGSARRDGAQHERSDRSGQDAGGGMFLGTLASSLLTPLRPYIEDAAKQVVAGFSDRQRSESDGAESPAAKGQPARERGGDPSAG